MTIKRYEARPPSIEAVLWDGSDFGRIRGWLSRYEYWADVTKVDGALVVVRGRELVARVTPPAYISVIDGNVRVWLVDDGMGDRPQDVFLKQYREVTS